MSNFIADLHVSRKNKFLPSWESAGDQKLRFTRPAITAFFLCWWTCELSLLISYRHSTWLLTFAARFRQIFGIVALVRHVISRATICRTLSTVLSRDCYTVCYLVIPSSLS